MIRNAERLTMTVVLIAMYCRPALAQAPASTLKVELRNVVEYQVDTFDLSKYGTNTGLTVGSFTAAGCLGSEVISLGDFRCATKHTRFCRAMARPLAPS